MEKALIIELLYHHFCVEILYEIYKNNYATHVYIGEFVNCFFDKPNLKENIHIISQPIRCKKFKMKGIKRFLYEIVECFEFLKNTIILKKYIKKEKPSLIHLVTIENPFIIPLVYVVYFFYKGKIAVTLHETHHWGVDKRFSHLSDYLLYWIPFWLITKKLSYFSILGEYIKIPNNLKKKKFFVINSRPIDIQEYEYLGDNITFAITGNVKKKRKNYRLVFRAFDDIFSKHPELRRCVSVVLLGKMHEPDIYKMIKTHDLVENITTFDKSIKEKIFKDIIKKTDFLIIPTYKDSPYGSTKISGSFGDAVSFGIPFLLSKYYAEDFSFPKNIIRFDDDSLEDTLLDCINIKFNKDEYMKLKEKAIMYSKNFNEVMKRVDFSKF